MVDLIHLKNNVVWHASFSQQHVQLPRHAPSNGVDAEPAQQTKFHTPAGSKGPMIIDLHTTEKPLALPDVVEPRVRPFEEVKRGEEISCSRVYHSNASSSKDAH